MSSFPAVVAAVLQQAFGLIERQILGAPAASITFSGIDTANKMFRLSVYIIKDGTNGVIQARLNNDAGAGQYEWQRMFGSGATVAAFRDSSDPQFPLWDPAGLLGANQHLTSEVHIAKQQTGDEAMMLVQSTGVDSTPVLVQFNVAAIWNNTADLISRIDLISGAGNFDTDTVAILEGNETV